MHKTLQSPVLRTVRVGKQLRAQDGILTKCMILYAKCTNKTANKDSCPKRIVILDESHTYGKTIKA